MITIAFPDALCWQAGMEFGLTAVSQLKTKGARLKVSFADHGPMLEAVSFAILDFGLEDSAIWVHDRESTMLQANLALFPRVVAGDREIIERAIERGLRTFSSDPEFTSTNPLFTSFLRRDVEALERLLAGFYASAARH